MIVIAVDPGTYESAFVEFEYKTEKVLDAGILDNHNMGVYLRDYTKAHLLVIEMVQGQGMPVGSEVFETCVAIGRFKQIFEDKKPYGNCTANIYRRDEKSYICGSPKAADGNMRAALIDMYGPTKEEAVGVKKNPGPLYGLKLDMWQALAVAMTYKLKREDKQKGKKHRWPRKSTESLDLSAGRDQKPNVVLSLV